MKSIDLRMGRWTPYVFQEDGRLNHTGANTFNMWKTKEKGWVTSGIADIAKGGSWEGFRKAEGVLDTKLGGISMRWGA